MILEFPLLWSPDRDLEVLADPLYGPLKTTENNKTVLDYMIIVTFKKEIQNYKAVHFVVSSLKIFSSPINC